MLDIGAGWTLMQRSLCRCLDMSWGRLNKESIHELKSCNDSDISAVGQAQFKLRLYPGHAEISTGFNLVLVIPSRANLPQ